MDRLLERSKIVSGVGELLGDKLSNTKEGSPLSLTFLIFSLSHDAFCFLLAAKSPHARVCSTGQPEWWAEPGLRCEATRHHKYRPGIHAKFREEDPNWFVLSPPVSIRAICISPSPLVLCGFCRYDRKVEDGTSMAGAFGMDTTAFPNLAIKGDTPGDLPDFQEKVSPDD